METERTLTPYPVKKDVIAEQSSDPDPKIVYTNEEYDEILSKYGLIRGTRLSDEGILRAMEAGLIKIWDEEGGFNLDKQIQFTSVDLHLGHNFFWQNFAREDGIRMGEHIEVL